MTNYDDLERRARRLEMDVARATGERDGIEKRIQTLLEDIQTLFDDSQIFAKTTELLNSLGEERQLRAQQVIENLVTRGLHTIFDDTLSFHIAMSVRGKTSVVDFSVRTTLGSEVVETSVMDARGGGLAAIIGFLLRMVVLSLRTANGGAKVIVLDETFAHVSAEYLHGVRDFLKELIELTGVQIIMVTHQQEFESMADKVYRFDTKHGKTQVEG